MNCRYEFAGIPEYATGVEWARLETPNSELVRRGENIKPLKNLLVVIAATGVIGSAQAQTPGNTFDLGTLSPTVQATTDTFASGSFLDTFNFTVDSTNHIVAGTTDSSGVSNLKLELFNSQGTSLFTGLNLNADLTPGNFFAQVSGNVVTGPGTFTLSLAAHNPERAEWMLMLCGVVVAGFISRRKIGLRRAPWHLPAE